MTFEEGLVKELSEVIKTYPLVAPEGVATPFLTYKKNNVEFKKTLSGTSNKVTGEYNLVIVAKKYEELQRLEETVSKALLDVYQKNIGDNGPYIENLTVKLTGDNYIVDTDEYVGNINLKINY